MKSSVARGVLKIYLIPAFTTRETQFCITFLKKDTEDNLSKAMIRVKTVNI